MDTLPAPLLGPEVDLRDFPFMPLDVVRLRDSSLSVEASGDEFRAAVLLWCAAWHQSPAGSLPDNDAALAQYAGYGRVVKEWLKVKDGALRGWIKCSDGRLYHPVVCEKAEKAWAEKAGYAARKAADRERKRGKKPAEQSLELPTPSNGNDPNYPQKASGASDGIPAENALKGEGEEREKKEHSSAGEPAAPSGAGIPAEGNPTKALFDAGVKLLTGAGQTDKQARAIVGQLRKAKGDEGALSVVLAAARATDPVSYIQAAVKHGGPANDTKPRPQAADWAKNGLF